MKSNSSVSQKKVVPTSTPLDFTMPPMPNTVKANLHVITDFFSIEIGKVITRDIIGMLDKVYFRSRLINFEEAYPQRNNPTIPLIFASNHSGMAFPWDGIIFTHRIHQLCNYGKDAIRPLTDPMLSQSVLMNPYQIKNFWRLMGCVDATFTNFKTMMYQNDHNLLVYPEGVPGIGKGFNRRYQLQRISSSMVHMAIRFKTDIIPVATVNAEFINPYTYCSPAINRISQLIGIPFIPLGIITPFILLFPWFFYMAFPAKLTFVRGKRIKPYEMTSKPWEDLGYKDLREISDRIHQQMQAELTAAAQIYGKHPYQWKELFRSLGKCIQYFPYTVPFGWPLLFAEFERVRLKNKDKSKKIRLGFLSTFRIILHNPFVLCYFIPLLGWIPLGIKGFRRVKPTKTSQ
ncbi:MAG: hypothetical protein AAF734_09355 [Bacteroidota bacterium]